MKPVLINPFGMSYYGNVRYPSIFPLGLGHLAASSKLKGFDVEILDCDLDNISPRSQEFLDKIVNLAPTLVGVSYWSFNKENVVDTLRVVKSKISGVVTVVGGPAPSVIGEKCVEDPFVDYAFRGEAKLGFPMLLDALSNGKTELKNIPGLTYQVNGEIHSNDKTFPDNLDELGHVDYNKMQLKKYHQQGYRYGPGSSPSAPIQATLGCPGQCQFCAARQINGSKIRFMSVPYLMEEISRLYEEFGVRRINFVDDNFTFNKDYALKVCNAIENMKLEGLTLASPNGIHLERIDKELIEAMSRAGWSSLMVAPETGSERTLARMKKHVVLSTVPEKVKMMKDAGLFVTGSFIIGYPDETIDDIKQTSNFIGKCGFHMISVNKFQPLPGTPIFKDLVECGEIPQDFVPVDTMGPSKYAPKGMTCSELDRIHRRIYLNFFFRSPLNTLRSLWSAGISRAYKRLKWLFSSRNQTKWKLGM